MNALPRHRFALAAIALVATAPSPAATDFRDTPLKITQPFDTTFPAALLADGITSGHVRAVLHVDAEGRLADCLAIAYTHHQLARELLAGLRDWQFEPAREGGESIGTRSEVVFNFEARGSVLTLTAGNIPAALTRWVAPDVVNLVCRPIDLDQPLTAVRTVRPAHPGPALRPPQPTGSAVIDFYVDAEGRPRMPVVAGASHAAFGAAALDALAQWLFSPPTRAGQPAVVRVRQTFLFSDRPEPARGTD
jgi:TonB family protein